MRPDPADPDGGLFIIDANGNILGKVRRSEGLNYKMNLVVLPDANEIRLGNIPEAIAKRIPQDQVQQIIDCIES